MKRCAISVWTYRPDAIFSVDAVGWGPAPDESFSESLPYRQVFQDWGNWLEQGWLDLVLRMGYKREWVEDQAKQYRDWADYTIQLNNSSEGRLVTVGIGGYFNPISDTITQYQQARIRGLGTSLFSYDRPTQEASDGGPEERGPNSPIWERLGADVYTTPAPAPLPMWRKDRAFIAGFLKDAEGYPIAGGKIYLAGTDYKASSDGSGFFAFFNLSPGSYQLKAPGNSIDTTVVDAVGGKVTWVK